MNWGKSIFDPQIESIPVQQGIFILKEKTKRFEPKRRRLSLLLLIWPGFLN